MAHTPGPWIVRSVGEHRAEVTTPDDAKGLHLGVATAYAGLYSQGCGDVSETARLIAAAPDLLAACEAALKKLIGYHMDGRGQYCVGCGTCTLDIPMLRAAIAKARGNK